MILSTFKKYSTLAALVGLVVLQYVIVSNSIDYGYNKAATKYTKVIKDYEENINTKIDNIELLAGTISKDLKTTEVTISKDLKTILVNSKKQPATVVVDGKCYPSEDYKATVKALHKKANEGLK